jgi:phosphoribosyl 1,2-cyclic phosphodiesterase
MQLIVINSNSAGNAYALDSGKEILLLEAGCKMADVKRAINFRLADVVGCICTHAHLDHAKYATEYVKFGVNIYGPQDIADKKQFPYGKFTALKAEKTVKIGSFMVAPFANYHDVPIFGYIINHPDCGSILFSTDTYKMGLYVTGIKHYLIEANYSDEFLKQNVWNGSINQKQADRIMLSHMSLEYTIKYLWDCGVGGCEKAPTQTITLCHLSERNSDHELFRSKVAGTFGIPVFVAQKGLVVELNKEEI